MTVLAEGPFVDGDGVARTHHAVLFQKSNGAMVFSAGTNYWSWKLDDNENKARGADARVQQMTRNLLNTMIAGQAQQPASLTLTAIVVNDEGGTAQPSDMTILIDSLLVVSGSATELAPGTYTVGQAPPNGYEVVAIGGECASDGTITLASGQGAACTITSDDVPPPPTGLTIYDDALNPSWANWSWNTTVDFAAATPVFSGSASLSAEVTRIWGGLYLHADAPIDLSPYSELRFLARATAPGQIYWVYLTDPNNQRLGNAIQLSQIAGDPVSDRWTEYRLPLDASGLDVGGGPISGFIFQDYSGSPHPPVYLDEIGFVGASPSSTPDEGTLIITLTISNDDGGTAVSGDVTLRIDGAPVFAGVAQTLPVGAHTVTVDPLPGYTVTLGGACAASGDVTLAGGDALTCTVLANDHAAAATPVVVASDGFEANLSGGSGWVESSWTTSGDASVRKSRRSAYEGSRDLRLRRGTGFAARSVDLRGYADALLRACVRVRSFEGSDRALVLFSTDGGATRSTVHIFVNGDDDNTYHCFEWALPAGLVVTIAFDAAMSGKRDQVWFDAIEVVARPGG